MTKLENFTKNKAFFLDRDGVIIEDKKYLSEIKKIRFLKQTFKALNLMKKKEYLLIIITNQSAIARGYLTQKQLKKIHKFLTTKLKNKGIKIDDIYYCPHHPKIGNKNYKKKCKCRKPGNLMIEKAIAKWNIDRKISFMIGDKISDKLAAKKSNIKFLYRSKHNFYKQINRII